MSTAALPTPATSPPSMGAGADTVTDALARMMGVLPPGRSLLLTGTTWDQYLELCERRDELGSRVKLTYHDGRLELVTTSFFHDGAATRLLWIVSALAVALKLDFRAGGRTTFRREDLERGLEPDECFYIQSVAAIRGVRRIDLSVHPAPDLAVEVDFSRSSIPKQVIYSALGVSELWRFEDEAVSFLVRQPDGSYQVQPASRAFPLLTSADATRLVGTEPDSDYLFLEAVQTWVRTLVPPPQP